MTITISCIGAGRVTRIFLEGLAKKNHLPHRIIVVDTNADTLKNLNQLFPMIETMMEIDETVTTADFIMIALHPQSLMQSKQLPQSSGKRALSSPWLQRSKSR